MATDQLPSALPKKSWDLTEHKDEIVEEIHTWREQFAAQFGYDLNRMFEYLQSKEAKNPAPRAALQPLKPSPPKTQL
jgi:hypothetical protein